MIALRVWRRFPYAWHETVTAWEHAPPARAMFHAEAVVPWRWWLPWPTKTRYEKESTWDDAQGFCERIFTNYGIWRLRLGYEVTKEEVPDGSIPL